MVGAVGLQTGREAVLLNELWVWLIDNKNWLFSGAGVAILGWLFGFLLKKRDHRVAQTIRSGHGSVNIQAGGDLHVPVKKRVRDVEKK